MSLLSSLLFSSAAIACSCITYNSPLEHIEANEVVFVGLATETIRPSPVQIGGFKILRLSTTFKIFESLRGGSPSIITINHREASGGQCGVSFTENNSYLVFATMGKMKNSIHLFAMALLRRTILPRLAGRLMTIKTH